MNSFWLLFFAFMTGMTVMWIWNYAHTPREPAREITESDFDF